MIDWIEIQRYYDNNHTWDETVKYFKTSSKTLSYGKKNGKFITRNISEANKLASKLHPRKLSEITKNKISIGRKKYLEENPDKVPYKLNHHSNGDSYPERYFKNVFRKRNVVFEEEFPISYYSLDIAIIDKLINIEIDGEQHYLDKRIIESNKKRDAYLNENGWKIIRIRWSEYRKMTFVERTNYIDNLVDYITNNVFILPKIVDNHNHCVDCNIKITKKATRCIKCNSKQNKKKEQLLIDTESLCHEKKYCKLCGIIISGQGKTSLCHACHSISARKVDRPSKEQLLIDVNTLGYSKTGRKYGVSDNAIRKWIK